MGNIKIFVQNKIFSWPTDPTFLAMCNWNQTIIFVQPEADSDLTIMRACFVRSCSLGLKTVTHLWLLIQWAVRIRWYRIAKCDTISTNCYAFAQNASQKVRHIVFCENEWVIAPLTSVKNSCWSTFSKPKSSNFKAEKFVQLQHQSMVNTSKQMGKHLPLRIYFGVDVFTIPTPCNSTHYIARTTDTEEHNTWT